MKPLHRVAPLNLPGLHLPAVEPQRSPMDWAEAAKLAADRVAEAKDRAARYRPGSGELPAWWQAAWSPPKPYPVFPWSRQPLTSWFDVDFDRKNLVTTIRLGRRCRIVFLWIEPLFACVLDQLAPDPGRSDLFDRKYLPAPLELPKSDLPPARASWRPRPEAQAPASQPRP